MDEHFTIGYVENKAMSAGRRRRHVFSTYP